MILAHVKGGMPVQVTGQVFTDEMGAHVENIKVMWPASGKPVTQNFIDSLTESDWDAMAETIANG